MQMKIAKLTQELNATQSQLNEILMGVNQTVNNAITTAMLAGKNEDQQKYQLDPSYHVASIPRSQWRVQLSGYTYSWAYFLVMIV